MSFIELCCRSYFSFLEGVSSPEQLVQEAVDRKMTALGLVDRNGLYGASAFYRACCVAGIHPIIGAQLTLEDQDEIILLCRNMAGYQKLSQLITTAHRGRNKGSPLLRYDHLQGLQDDLIGLVGGKIGRLSQLVCQNRGAAQNLLRRYVASFGSQNLYVALTHHCEEGDTILCQRLSNLADDEGLISIVTNHPHYAKQADGKLHDVLHCIKNRTTLRASHAERAANHERYLKGEEELGLLFAQNPKALETSCVIAACCELTLEFSCYRFPTFPVPTGYTVDSYLAHLCREAFPKKYPATPLLVLSRVEQELSLIAKLQLAGYFLVVWDIVQFAKRKGIPVQGRGSAANSIVTYLLGITPVDPVAHKLFLGRFLHEEMKEIPDIDLDFAATRRDDLRDREEVIQYVYRRYGADHVAMVCTYVTFQTRSAIREVGQVLEMPQTLLERMAKLSNPYGGELFAELNHAEFQTLLKSKSWEPFKQMVTQIVNLPRHLGIHVGGMVIASCPIAQLVPLEPARMEGRVVCQWDKDMVGDAGLVKVDILGLGMLAVLRDAAEFLPPEMAFDPDTLSYEDPAVYDALARADTVGAFQVESRAQMQSLPRTRPQNFSELGIQVAIIRPGPLQGNMVSPYIRRKRGEEAVTYLHPVLKPILEETLGVILFQEQVLLCAVAIAGFTSAEADALRRAMSRKRSREAMVQIRADFLAGAKRNRIPLRSAEQVFDALEGFALYGFCKSHALSFARLTYLSVWFKIYHPAPFLAALLNNQPMGFYSVETLIEDAKRHGVVVHSVDVNWSDHCCRVVGEKEVRLGFLLVKGMGEVSSQSIERSRASQGPFTSLRVLVQRTNLRPQLVENLIQAGACDGWGLERRELLWQLWLVQRMGLFCEGLFASQEVQSPPLPPSSEWDKLLGEYRTMGLSVKRHPVYFLRPEFARRGAIPSGQLTEVSDGDTIAVAGMVICRQRPPTAKGFAFLTLEDEEGLVNIIVAPQLYESSSRLFRQSSFLLVRGLCQKSEGLINVLASQLEE